MERRSAGRQNRHAQRPRPSARTNEKAGIGRPRLSFPEGKSSVLERRLVRNGQLLAPLRTARSQHLATVRRGHTGTEPVFVDPLATRRLVSSLHCHSYLIFIVSYIFTDCKSTTKKRFAKIFRENISKSRTSACEFLLSLPEKSGAPPPSASRRADAGPDRRRTLFLKTNELWPYSA